MSLIEDPTGFFSIFVRHKFLKSASFEGGSTIKVNFRTEYVEALDIAGMMPTATCLESDVPGVTQGDSLIVTGIPYRVKSVEPDGTGYVVLRLEKV